MPHEVSLRWRRSGAATAALLALVGTAGCSGSSHHASPSSQPTATVDVAAAAALGKAIASTRALHAYAFQATQTLSGGPRQQVTTVNGRALRPRSLTYTLTVDATVQTIVRIGPTVFVKLPNKPWKALAKPVPTADPIASLLALLTGAEHPSLTGKVLTADVPAAALSEAQLAPAGASPGATAPVRFVLDATGRVTSLTLTLTVRAGTQTLTVADTTTFTSFDHVAPITAPGVIKKR